jgi:hypothetical protein
VKLIQSDSVIRPVVEQFHLTGAAQTSESRVAYWPAIAPPMRTSPPASPTPSPSPTAITPTTSAFTPPPISPPSWSASWRNLRPRPSAPPPPSRSLSRASA